MIEQLQAYMVERCNVSKV